MGARRTKEDLTIYEGRFRSFEWFWDDDDSMPGLDAFEALSEHDQNDFLASIEHWGNIAPGLRPLSSRVNDEHKAPLIVAVKVGKHRFTAFREESGPTWIIFVRYLKRTQERDKAGDRAVTRTLGVRLHYFERVNNGTYYQRG